jgi:hypothetical protein
MIMVAVREAVKVLITSPIFPPMKPRTAVNANPNTISIGIIINMIRVIIPPMAEENAANP